jgi:hypothetical protein
LGLFVANTGQPKCLSMLQQMPNPSLEWTATGMALGPPAGVVHHPAVGPSAIPASAAQLKR